MTAIDYVVISPVRNEAKYLPQTIQTMVAQSIRPRLWVLVDDGSTDPTGDIIEGAAREHSWIRTAHRPDRGERQAGGGVIDAFYDGYKLVHNHPPQFLVKLDGDVTFEPGYFERCFMKFEGDSRLGIGGGLVCFEKNGTLEEESKVDPSYHVRGATKIYRQACWDQLGGLIRAPGWDTLDEVKANMLGWKSLTFRDIPLIHHRPTGQAYGTWKNWTKNGRANYVAGYHPIFMAVKCVKRIFEKPYGVCALGLMVGFCSGYVKRMPQIDDRELIRFFRKQQMNRLLGRKSLWNQ